MLWKLSSSDTCNLFVRRKLENKYWHQWDFIIFWHIGKYYFQIYALKFQNMTEFWLIIFLCNQYSGKIVRNVVVSRFFTSLSVTNQITASIWETLYLVEGPKFWVTHIPAAKKCSNLICYFCIFKFYVIKASQKWCISKIHK